MFVIFCINAIINFLLVLVSLQQILCLQINKNNVVEKYFVKIKNLGIIIVVLKAFYFQLQQYRMI